MIEFKRTPFMDAWLDIETVASDHTRETLGFRAKPNLAAYAEMCKQGALLTFVAYDDLLFIGYATIIIVRDPHNTDRTLATQDGIYIVPSHRNGTGRRFIQWQDRYLERIGISEIIRHARVTAPTAARVYQSLGYEPAEVSYRLGLTV